MRRGNKLLLVGLALLALMACGCFPGPNPNVGVATHEGGTAGFLLGFWHGMIAWVTFILSLFDPRVSIYEVHNNGWPYNLGFLLGAAGVLGGGVAGSRKRPRKSD